jgi:hypothetical protein
VETYSGEWTCTATADTRAVLTADPHDSGSYGVRSSYVDGTIGADGYDPAAVASAVTTAASSGTFTSTCEPRLEGHEWRKPENYNFDNIGASMLVLFETATLEMWLEVMYHSVDAVEEGTQPRLNHNEGAALFYVVFIIIGAFFVMNLFVGVTIDKFNEMKETQEEEDEIEGRAKGASLFVTEEQRRWQLVERMMSKCKPTRVYEPPKHVARARVFHVVTNPAFDVFIMVCILANVIVMCLSYADEPDQWTIDLFIANSFFTFVFMCEVIAKITALGPKAYMEDPWNRFDFTVVGFSLDRVHRHGVHGRERGFYRDAQGAQGGEGAAAGATREGLADAAADVTVLAPGARQRRQRAVPLLLHLRHHGHEPVRQGEEGGPPDSARQL